MNHLFNNLDGSPFFVGRAGEIEAIDESLIKTGIVEIVGLGGTGKTTLANAYTTMRRERYGDRIIRYQAYSGAGLSSYVYSLADSFRGLEGPLLCIVDSAEVLEPGDTIEAIRRLETGPWIVHFMILSRVRLGIGTTIPLDGLVYDSFQQLLRRAIGYDQFSDMDVTQLWKDTGGSPHLLKTLLSAWSLDRNRPIGTLGQLLEPLNVPGILGPDGRPVRRGSDREQAVIERVQLVTGEMLHRIAMRPDLVFELDSRQFEELAAELFSREGFEVTLTPRTRDGGKDLYLAQRRGFATFQYAVECKRYHPNRPVAVDVVRKLAGVVNGERLNAGIVLTTSRFTKDAYNVAAQYRYQMSLSDFTTLKTMLEPYGSAYR